MYKPKSPEDMIPDHKDYMETKGGVRGRKGTMAAALANADIIEAEDATEEEKRAALEMLRTLAPQLKALGVTTHLRWKNEAIQKVFDEA
ncbi:MAG: hypothetical protein AAGF92_19065 [Myxococcota bacterium]